VLVCTVPATAGAVFVGQICSYSAGIDAADITLILIASENDHTTSLPFDSHPGVPAGAAPLAVAQLGVTTLASADKSATAVLTISSATAAIQSCAFEARNQLVFDMDSRLKAAANPCGC